MTKRLLQPTLSGPMATSKKPGAKVSRRYLADYIRFHGRRTFSQIENLLRPDNVPCLNFGHENYKDALMALNLEMLIRIDWRKKAVAWCTKKRSSLSWNETQAVIGHYVHRNQVVSFEEYDAFVRNPLFFFPPNIDAIAFTSKFMLIDTERKIVIHKDFAILPEQSFAIILAQICHLGACSPDQLDAMILQGPRYLFVGKSMTMERLCTLFDQKGWVSFDKAGNSVTFKSFPSQTLKFAWEMVFEDL